MGSTATLIGAVALATALICLFLGYLWGRSNVRSQIEDALDKARISADAREFALREELDEKMVELGEFRGRAEEFARLQEQLGQLKSARMHGSASGSAAAEAPGNNTQASQKVPEEKQSATPVIDSTEITIQNLLKSIEEKINQHEEEPRIVTEKGTTPVVTELPLEARRAVSQQDSKPTPTESPAVEPIPGVKDEWQEFADSLAALKSRQK